MKKKIVIISSTRYKLLECNSVTSRVDRWRCNPEEQCGPELINRRGRPLAVELRLRVRVLSHGRGGRRPRKRDCGACARHARQPSRSAFTLTAVCVPTRPGRPSPRDPVKPYGTAAPAHGRGAAVGRRRAGRRNYGPPVGRWVSDIPSPAGAGADGLCN
ncbi:hypothetical protein EVAR_96751_1 [Eumeta japonica]|uniref:Uncharacterized protein n=1 Tax=Eumeta variegata TaxID=151549 RepID=A0A4C1Y3X5_EUMVA|nr:hypothetical protein EVAR_96751_1 [Eumeta japonica]